MELLPALALALGFLAQFCVGAIREFKPRDGGSRWITTAAVGILVLIALNAVEMVHERPLVYVEGLKNIQAHRPYQTEIPQVLRTLLAQRPGATILIDTSVDPEIVALTGIPLRQTINEADLQIFTDALAAPASHAAIILALDGDEIDRAVHAHPEGLTVYERFTAPGQPTATLYVSDTPSA
jgi:hypothetical protein